MKNVCCTNCRLRFTPVAAANLLACPECGEPPVSIRAADGLLGFRLYTFDEAPDKSPQARAVTLPIPGETGVRP
jgi:hypothetical protein